MITRSCHPQERIFPVISENLYKPSFAQAELTADKQAAYNLLALVTQKFSGHLNVLNQFRSLLCQHQLAIEAELASKWQRADFFWRQVQIEFKALSEKQTVWQELAVAVASHPEVKVMNNPAQLRQCLLDELFIDTHCAFYNGLILKTTKPSRKERAFVHIDYIQQLMKLSRVSSQEAKTLLGEAWQTRIAACKEAQEWRQAIYYCQARLKYLPNDIEFQGELAEVHYSATLAKCWHAEEIETEAQHLQNARILQAGIKALEKCLKSYPHNLTIFELLSDLYHLRTVSLANSNLLALALTCSQKAITYNPHNAPASTTRNQLIDRMEQLQKSIEQFQAQGGDNLRLSQKEQNLVKQGKLGFAPINAYIDSKKAKATAEAFKIAQAIYLWHLIGLPEPRDGWIESATGILHILSGKIKPIQSPNNSIKTALQVQEAVNIILQYPPNTKAEVPSAWETVVEHEPDLALLDAAQICGYIEHSLFGEGENRVLITPPIGHSELPLILTPTSTKSQMSTEPFIPWLFSSQDKRIKLQVLVASVLLVTIGCIAIRDKTIVAERENAYQTILAAKQVQNDQAVLKASKQFFKNVQILGKDERTPQVIEIFRESLVRWFAQKPQAQLEQADQEYLELYKQLEKTAIAQEKQS